MCIRDRVNDEDYLLGIEIQKGLNSQSNDSVLFGRNEKGNQFFHKYVDYYVDDNIKEPPKDQLQNLINLYTKGQYKAALNRASQLLEQFPQSINLYNIIGAAKNGLGKPEEAIEAFNKALSINPDNPKYWKNLFSPLQALKAQVGFNEDRIFGRNSAPWMGLRHTIRAGFKLQVSHIFSDHRGLPNLLETTGVTDELTLAFHFACKFLEINRHLLIIYNTI